MITPSQIRKKALVPWNSGAFLKSCIDGPPIFPLEIRFRTPGGNEILEKYDTVRQWIRTLKNHSKETKPKGYDIVWRNIRHRTLGQQQMPQRIVFSTEQDWLFYIQKETAHLDFVKMATQTGASLPELLPYLSQQPLKALKHAARWPDILTVCRWFKTHPMPRKYIRQLDIADVDTKFIETQKSVLMDLLPLVLEEAHYQSAVTGLAKHGFERKFGLRYDPPLVRLRLLDSALIQSGFSDITVPLAEFAQTDPGAETIFITENKINGLAFPQVNHSLVIFGLGYGVEMLQDIPWLGKKVMIYWGDIDTHGFAILSQIRGYFPNVRSMLMDRTTLMDHKALWGQEDPAKRYAGDLHHLTPEEYDLFVELKQNKLNTHVRLEQERVRFSTVQKVLKGYLL